MFAVVLLVCSGRIGPGNCCLIWFQCTEGHEGEGSGNAHE